MERIANVKINFTAPIVIKGMRIPYRTSTWSNMVHIDMAHLTEPQKNYIIMNLGNNHLLKNMYGDIGTQWLICDVLKLLPLFDQLKDVFGLELYAYNPFGEDK